MARIFASRDFRAHFLRRSFANQSLVTPEMLDEMMLATRSAGYLAGTTAMMGQYRTGDEPDVARRVQVPTLICWGMQDRGKPPGELAGLARLMPAARIVRFAEAGHYVHEEEPEGVAAAIIAAASAWQ
jgi:pimeloyl-ACP methyl ester carboxylesterase